MQLSGGQQQRCALARALVKRADLVLLDEPLVNLDYKLREELRAELPRSSRRGTTVVYATTEPLEALLLGGCTVGSEGRVLQVGDARGSTRARHDRVAAVFNDPPMNMVGIEKSNGCGALRGGVAGAGHRGSMPTLPTAPIASASAPISSSSPTGSSGRHAFPAT